MKVISGGQTGADMGGTLSAYAVGLATGGYMPWGYRQEHGHLHNAQVYGFEQITGGYANRTMKNVQMADAVCVFSPVSTSPGTELTWAWINYLDKKALDCTQTQGVEILEWLQDVRPGVLMVAGNRESKAPGLQAHVYETLMPVFRQIAETFA